MAEQGVLPILDKPALEPGPVFLCFEIQGKPGHKGRHRSRLVIPTDAWTGFGANAFIFKANVKKLYIQQYPDPETAKYEAMVAEYAGWLMKRREPSEQPLALLVHAFIPVPKSWSKRDQAEALFGGILPTSRPDGDNYLKIVDALNGIVWKDDAQVVDARVIKRYSSEPALRIEVREFVPATGIKP